MKFKLAGCIILLLCIGYAGVVYGQYFDESMIYLGDSDQVYSGDFNRIGQITCVDVFTKIPEYNEIVQKDLTQEDGEYWILLKRANEKFQKALKKVYQSDGYDIICEMGTFDSVEEFDEVEIPDITKLVVNVIAGKKSSDESSDDSEQSDRG